MINFHKIKMGLLNFKGARLVYIYGTKDPSFTYIELLRKYETNKVEIIKLNNVDHDFTNKLETFCELPERYLFNVKME
jgi:alpha/beta superfamily hydrolase